MIIIAPYARPLRNGKPNPKNYPYWKELIDQLSTMTDIVQVGTEGEEQLVSDFRKNLTLLELRELVLECKTWISVDSFFQHFCWDINKPGIVLWGQGDPNIFGHDENVNLLVSREYLRPNQFDYWENTEYIQECFVDPKTVILHITPFLQR